MNYNNAKFSTSFGKFEQIPPSDRTEIAFSGRSNVGKSSLINKILNRKSLARVSSMPGKTVTINFYTVDNIYFGESAKAKPVGTPVDAAPPSFEELAETEGGELPF